AHTLISGSHDQTVRVWAHDDAAPASTVLTRDLRGDVIINDDRLAWRDQHDALWVDGRRIGATADLRHFQFSPDGRSLLGVGPDGTTLWESDGARVPDGPHG